MDADEDLLERKHALRGAVLAARRALAPAERTAASAAVVARLLLLPELRRARTVLLYAALADEVDLATAVGPLQEAGARVCLPRVDGDELCAVAATDPASLVVGHRGVREPGGPAIALGEIEVVVLPGVAFDRSGGRLGHGGGHYDRLLARLTTPTLRVGACFACQVVPAVPRAAHDLPVDVVVTERSTHRTRARVA